ncbi:J domain-containing protein [Geobacter sp. AOG2]|uniref:J domain-containing protein n=1 Tax=Geobacter sp. AOG2 TaxID=1566347 RepID=UPI001CC362A3|nr:hypothetical protein [Geobacter sp. AOG2]GFE61058.1 hypothetical protein AOG2_16450 [Geobacter sp. AOG2]
MTPPFRNSLKTPEEVELERKQRELKRFQLELGDWERMFSDLKAEIRTFEQLYEDTLGGRITVLEELEWQVNGILGTEKAPPRQESLSDEQVFSHFRRTTDLLDDDDESPPDTSSMSIKSLYRGVAKAVHPDLASDEADRLRRQELMSVANQAYESGDRKSLEELFWDWEVGTGTVSGKDIASELVRVIRQIARTQQNIHAVILQIDELKQTDIYRFKLRVADAQAEGIDLLAEMVAKADEDISVLRKRLSVLRGEEAMVDTPSSPNVKTRVIRFPADKNYGTLYVRNVGSMDYRDWQWLGNARGVKEIFLNKGVRLDVKGVDGNGLDFLDTLHPEDLQALFLNDVGDSALAHVTRLTGLQELCLSNTTISEEGLAQLVSLGELQRIYIYHTAIGDRGLHNLTRLKGLKWLTCSGTMISEEGLNHFRQALPDCKAVSFKWRYDK